MGIALIVLFGLLFMAGIVSALAICLVCAAVALYRRQAVWTFAIAGALFGAFIFPWPYVLARLYGRLLPYPIMGLIYLFAYGLWLIAILSVVTSIAWIWEYTLGTSTGYVASGASIGSASFMTLLYGGGIAVCGFAMFMSAKGLYKRYRLDRRDPLGTQIDSAYVTPFFYAYLWLAAALAVAFVNAHYMVSIGVDIQGF